MKSFMRRNHAEFLSRQFMGMALGEDIMRSLYNREALSHKAFSRDGMQQDEVGKHAEKYSVHENSGGVNS